jgi:hypothetical protein
MHRSDPRRVVRVEGVDKRPRHVARFNHTSSSRSR